ncbi:MAG: hypothetical protein ABSE63_03090 [Thermoguttaceae bacterium]|jgi:hypothetical protein
MDIKIFLICSLVFLSLAFNCPAAEQEKYTLRYQFHPGETLHWNVSHHSKVRTAVAGADQTVETISDSEKVWRIKEVKPDGTATFEHLVQWVDMRQNRAGTNEVRYDSRTDAKPPMGFEDVAASVGVPLSIITMDNRGKILQRQRKETKGVAANEGAITIPLPDEPVAVGHVWTFPCDIDVPLESGGVKKIKAIQQFKLDSVQTGVATISVSTQIITPVTEPAIEAQVVQREGTGVVRFDIDTGRIIGQRLDVDKHVVGFRGQASSLYYVTRFSEEWIPETANSAVKSSHALK